MLVTLYFLLKALAWAGLAFSLYSIGKPDWMLRFFIKTFQWRMKWCGLTGTVSPTPRARPLTRVWSAVLALGFACLVYVFTVVLYIGYALKQG